MGQQGESKSSREGAFERAKNGKSHTSPRTPSATVFRLCMDPGHRRSMSISTVYNRIQVTTAMRAPCEIDEGVSKYKQKH